jgi:coproporphyrinogen III oxidase-like Fe-S oxidoreductase
VASLPGLYLHVPFCSAICPYCDFAVLTGGPRRRAEFVASLLAEIDLRRVEGERWGGPFDTLYFGGGTPSALAAVDLERLLAAVRRALPIAAAAWIGFEANPEDVTAATLRQWRELGVSMLSLGVQSFDAATLRRLGRRHGPEQAKQAVELALATGFPTVSVDLMYGMYGLDGGEGSSGGDRRGGGDTSVGTHATDGNQRSGGNHARGGTFGTDGNGASHVTLGTDGTDGSDGADGSEGSEGRDGSDGSEGSDGVDDGETASLAEAARWRRDLEQAVALGPHHLSCYQLTIHEGTPFGFRAARGERLELPDAGQAEIFRFTHRYLAAHGYAGYEVSNFARGGAGGEHQSRHNRKYWNHTPYLGLGPSAHSFDGRRRWWNERKLRSYQARLATGELPVAGSEDLGRRDLALEEIMLSLRTAAGLDLAGFRRRYGFDLAARNRELIANLAAGGLLAQCGERLAPSLEGLAVADSLARSFDLGLEEAGDGDAPATR